MTKRANQTAEEIEQLAEHFRSLWREGRVLRSWLRTHAEEMRTFVREKNWSWETLGKALTDAGITYSTGTPWTGENLRRSLDKALLPTKREIKHQRALAAAAATVANLSGVPAPADVAASPEAAEEFQIIRRAIAKSAPSEGPLPPTLPMRKRPALNNEEIHAIAMGRSDLVRSELEN